MGGVCGLPFFYVNARIFSVWPLHVGPSEEGILSLLGSYSQRLYADSDECSRQSAIDWNGDGSHLGFLGEGGACCAICFDPLVDLLGAFSDDGRAEGVEDSVEPEVVLSTTGTVRNEDVGVRFGQDNVLNADGFTARSAIEGDSVKDFHV